MQPAKTGLPPNVADTTATFTSVGCVCVRRYENHQSIFPLWPQSVEKSRIEVEINVCLPAQHAKPQRKLVSGKPRHQTASSTRVRMRIRTCDGVTPACSVEFITQWQRIIPEYWDRTTMIRASCLNVNCSSASSSVLPAVAAAADVPAAEDSQHHIKTSTTSASPASLLLIFDIPPDRKRFDEFLLNVFEHETGLVKKFNQLHIKLPSSERHAAIERSDVTTLTSKNAVSSAAVATTTNKSCFDVRTDEASSSQYFQFYSYLSQQQNMLQDYLRTATYQRAILSNMLDFLGKTVMDVGAGSGILSFFAIQAGARKVYAVEASSMAVHCRRLVEANGLQDKIIVINKKLEEIDELGDVAGELVDVIISEPLGYMLVNERMLETYLHARKFLKPGGNMYPSQADLHCAPFCDESLYVEQLQKANFWHQNNFYGIDLSSLRTAAFEESFRQPVVDTFDMRILMAPSSKCTIDFLKSSERDLYTIHMPLQFVMHQNGTVHGLCFWFDAAFRGSEKTIWLSTAPSQPLTHWYQVRCLLQQPLFCLRGQTLNGHVTLTANARQSYDIDIMLTNSTTGTSATNQLDLKSPCFRMFAAAAVAAAAAATTTPTATTTSDTQERFTATVVS